MGGLVADAGGGDAEWCEQPHITLPGSLLLSGGPSSDALQPAQWKGSEGARTLAIPYFAARRTRLCNLHEPFAASSPLCYRAVHEQTMFSATCLSCGDASHNHCHPRNRRMTFRASQSENGGNSAALRMVGEEETLWILTVCGLLVKLSRIQFLREGCWCKKYDCPPKPVG